MSDLALDFKLDPLHTAIVVIDLQKGIAGIPGGAPHPKPMVIANSAPVSHCPRSRSAARPCACRLRSRWH
jgi:nicotinamidase-related amidase